MIENDIQDDSSFSPLRARPPDKKTALIWSLVLMATGISHKLKQDKGDWLILVPEGFRDEAEMQIERYEQENLPDETTGQEYGNRPIRYSRHTLWSLVLVAAVMSITFRYEIRDMVLSIGVADSDKIVDGQWWRVITAMFIHADPAHFLSNMMIGGFIIFWLVEEMGPGAGWFLAFFSGAVGNYINALVHGCDHHLSIGASTAIFGAIGALFSVRALKSGKKGLFREAIRTIGAALALLAMLGSGQGNIDLGAHLFGFTAGLIFGAGCILLEDHLPKKERRYTGRIFGAITLIIATSAWTRAVLYHFSGM